MYRSQRAQYLQGVVYDTTFVAGQHGTGAAGIWDRDRQSATQQEGGTGMVIRQVVINVFSIASVGQISQ